MIITRTYIRERRKRFPYQNDSAIENLVIRWWGKKRGKKKTFSTQFVFLIYLQVSVREEEEGYVSIFIAPRAV